MREGKPIQVQVDFSSEAHEQLQEIRKLSGAKTDAEAVSNSLRLYKWFMEQRKNGFAIQLVKGDTVKQVELFF